MLRLARGQDSLVIAPEAGASVIGWTRGGRHLFRRPSPESVLNGTPGAMGCFPLVPYCNRIARRHFAWRGVSHELAANFGDHPHAIHGVGWRRPWAIDAVASDSVTLSLRSDATGPEALAWPFAFSAQLVYELTGRGLGIHIEVTNLDVAPTPVGIGVHPYFPRAADPIIAFHADGVWRNQDSIPVAHEPVPAEWDHTNGRSADREPLDNCFTGWDGVARLPGLRIEADNVFTCLQVFTPAGADFFCVEPVSHAPDAINRPDLARSQSMAALETGQTSRGSIRFTPDP
jgi:aldose 1-epimerase